MSGLPVDILKREYARQNVTCRVCDRALPSPAILPLPTPVAGAFICAQCIDPVTGGIALAALCADNRVIDARIELTLEPQPNVYGRAGREVLPLASGMLVLPGQSVSVHARPQRHGLKVERLFISNAGTSGGAADWRIDDILIGGRSQLLRPGALPGDLLNNPRSAETFVSFEPCRLGMDLTLAITYVGQDPNGAQFYSSAIGSVDHDLGVHVLMRIDGVIYDFDVSHTRPVRPILVRALWPTEIPGTPGSAGVGLAADALLALFPPRVIALRMHEEIMWGVDEATNLIVLEIGCAVIRTEVAIPTYTDEDDDAVGPPAPLETRIEYREQRVLSNRWDLTGFDPSWLRTEAPPATSKLDA